MFLISCYDWCETRSRCHHWVMQLFIFSNFSFNTSNAITEWLNLFCWLKRFRREASTPCRYIVSQNVHRKDHGGGGLGNQARVYRVNEHCFQGSLWLSSLTSTTSTIGDWQPLMNCSVWGPHLKPLYWSLCFRSFVNGSRYTHACQGTKFL